MENFMKADGSSTNAMVKESTFSLISRLMKENGLKMNAMEEER
jgi:hypothetical protein